MKFLDGAGLMAGYIAAEFIEVGKASSPAVYPNIPMGQANAIRNEIPREEEHSVQMQKPPVRLQAPIIRRNLGELHEMPEEISYHSLSSSGKRRFISTNHRRTERNLKQLCMSSQD